MRDYLRKMWKTILLFFSFCGLFSVVFWLYGYPAEPVIYGNLLCLTVGTAAFLYGWNQFCKKKRQLLRLKEILPLELEELPEPEDSCEALCQEMLGSLNHMRMESEKKRMDSYGEMTDYYTMWVHQIKTPISALRLLLSEDKQKNKASINELFRVEEYVEMVLGYLRTEDISSDISLQSCSLDAVIREQIHKYASVFIGKKLKIVYKAVEIWVLTDPKWLGFVIGQCLSNALKYTRTGEIKIELSLSCPDTLVIRDTGVGISPEDLPRVFEKGFTGCNGRREEHSTGIGLYLCKKIMKKLNHEIRIESQPGQGTAVYLSLKRQGMEIF